VLDSPLDPDLVSALDSVVVFAGAAGGDAADDWEEDVEEDDHDEVDADDVESDTGDFHCLWCAGCVG